MGHESNEIPRKNGQFLTVKVPLGPNSWLPQLLFWVYKERTLRVAEDSEKQTPGVPSLRVIMHLGCLFSLARNSVWVCVFVFRKAHKGQNSRFPFTLQHPPFPTRRRNSINPQSSLKWNNQEQEPQRTAASLLLDTEPPRCPISPPSLTALNAITASSLETLISEW